MKVVIIGAGIAGLSAAAHLYDRRPADVVIIEARDRCGGRVHTKAFGDNIVEMGGNWIHGTASNNSMFVLACQNDLLNQRPPVDFKWSGRFCYLPDGSALDKSMCNLAYEIFSTIRDQMDGAVHGSSVPENMASVGDYLALQVDEELQKFDSVRRVQLKSIINTYTNFERMSTACDLSDASVKHYGCFGAIPGSARLYVPGGVTRMVDCISRRIPPGAILYNTEAKKITVDVNKAEKAVTVSCERKGAGGPEAVSYAADHVIVTAPLGYLKANVDDFFEPALPPSKGAAIKNIGYTGVEKLFIYYEKPFWELGAGGPLLCWPDEHYLKRTPDQWYVGMIGFAEYPYNNNVLFAWVPLPDCARMNSLDDAAIKRACAELFRIFLGNPSIPEPDEICRSAWCDDPYSLGTYSYMSKSSSPADVQALAQPVLDANQKPVVLFAGEATALPHYSTMHGARGSGMREAERILALSPRLSKL